MAQERSIELRQLRELKSDMSTRRGQHDTTAREVRIASCWRNTTTTVRRPRPTIIPSVRSPATFPLPELRRRRRRFILVLPIHEDIVVLIHAGGLGVPPRSLLLRLVSFAIAVIIHASRRGDTDTADSDEGFSGCLVGHPTS
jgi:hypothetical protein